MELPASLAAADGAAVDARRRTRRIYAAELTAIVVAALAGTAAWHVGHRDLDVLAAAATVAFAAALAAGIYRDARHPQSDWVKARAAAEAIRAAAWRYTVGGTPFRPGEPAVDDALFVYVRTAMATLSDLALPVPDTTPDEITPEMRAIRASTVDIRKEIYRAQRLDDQIDYYRRRSLSYDRARRYWFWFGMIANLAGIVGGVLRFVDLLNIDLVGVAAAIAGSAVAWTQLNQHRTLSTAYSQTLWQLIAARSQFDAVGEDDWPDWVDSVEDLMAQEHSVWLRKHTAATPLQPNT